MTGFALFGWAYFILTLVLFWQHDVVNSPMSFPRAVGESLAIVIGSLMVPSLGERIKMAEMMAAIVARVMEVDDNSRFLVACSLMGMVFAGARRPDRPQGILLQRGRLGAVGVIPRAPSRDVDAWSPSDPEAPLIDSASRAVPWHRAIQPVQWTPGRAT